MRRRGGQVAELVADEALMVAADEHLDDAVDDLVVRVVRVRRGDDELLGQVRPVPHGNFDVERRGVRNRDMIGGIRGVPGAR